MNVLYIRHSTSHHAKHSGYAQLIDYPSYPVIAHEATKIPYRIRKYISGIFSKDAGIYNSNSISKELLLTKPHLFRTELIQIFSPLQQTHGIKIPVYLLANI
mgnify:CR=1 FL=1